ncbi:MAG: family 16 glycosylhydrolase, partial [Bacteroidia bacterium]|nr:family 16 glycosylhydrolase [Bacteroidia bacterium]
MNKIFFVVFYSLCHIGYGQFLFQIDKDTCIKWNYLEGDEFNGKHYREDLWSSGFPWSRSLISEDIYYSDKNVLVDSGLAKFRVNREKTITKLYDWEHDSVSFKRENKFPDNEGRYELSYTGGLLWSKKKYRYGYFEARFKNPQSTGFWPAFWLYGEKTNEIDFMELKGEKTSQLHVDIHCPEGCRNYIEGFFGYRKAFGHWVKTTGDFAKEFDVISGEWQPSYVKYYLNGNLIAYFSGNIDVPLALTVGNGKAHEGGPFAPGVNEKTLFPSDFIVDYVRIWSKADTIKGVESVPKAD